MKEKTALNPTAQTGANPVSQRKPAVGDMPVATLLNLILASLEDSKAEDVTSINIEGKSPIADHLVIASGRSHRHVGAVSDHLLRVIKEAGLGTAKVEGLPACDWVLVDAGDVIVHIFRPEVREFYNLEKMWMTADLGRTEPQ